MLLHMHDEVRREASGPGFVSHLSIWKSAGVFGGLLIMSICPMLPGFSDGLKYTAFLVSPALFPRLASTGRVLGVLARSFMAVVWRAVTGLSAVQIWPEKVRVRAIRDQSFDLGAVRRVAWSFGNLVVQTDQRKRVAIPIWLLKNGRETLQRLEAAGLKIPAR